MHTLPKKMTIFAKNFVANIAFFAQIGKWRTTNRFWHKICLKKSKTRKELRTMKKCLLIATLIVCLPNLYATVIDKVATHFGEGDAEGIAQYLNANVELFIKNANNVFTRQQTETILNDFFKKNPVKEFTVSDQGERDGKQFALGKLETQNGTFRIYFMTKNNLIQQLRIETSK